MDQRHNALIKYQIRVRRRNLPTNQLPPLSSTAMQARRGVCAAQRKRMSLHGAHVCFKTRLRGIENIMSPQSCRHGGRQGARVECDSSTPKPPLHPRAPPLELTRTIPHKIIHSPAHHTESRTPCSKGSHHLSIKNKMAHMGTGKLHPPLHIEHSHAKCVTPTRLCTGGSHRALWPLHPSGHQTPGKRWNQR